MLVVFLLTLMLYVEMIICKAQRIKVNLLALALLYEIVFAGSFVIARQNLTIFFIPFAAVPMLATILFGIPQITLILTLGCAISVIIITNNAFFGILFLISGIVSGLLVQDVRKRSFVIKAGCIVGFLQVACLLLIERPHFSNSPVFWLAFINGVVSSIIALGILPLFEWLFKVVTNISLLELADFNHPLLQRMVMEAPGTYHHSLIVGNLSDAAATAIHGHALLARIGAYYHDIGKLAKPQYFSENQCLQENAHDALAPTMSKLVIMNHVKDGVELAQKHKLNQQIIDFIRQHHGSSLAYYFYRRALENVENEARVEEESFRYPGPKPNTRETAIVLLADSVEAATRTLKDPAPDAIREMVHKIVNNKFIDGQLDECDLTLKDLEKISAVFIRILTGMHHGRVNYPERPGENNGRKPSKEGSHSQGGNSST